jgi:hypothetical protein
MVPMDWIKGINWEKPMWGDIARLLAASYIEHRDERERSANYRWIVGIIKQKGPEWVYKNGKTVRNTWEFSVKPLLRSEWELHDREKYREGLRRAEGEKRKRESKPEWLTYSSSDPPPKGIIKRALWRRKKRKKPPIETV